MRIIPGTVVVLFSVISTTSAWWIDKPKSVDCGDTGVFTLGAPYDESYWKLPQCPDEIRPTFTLYTRLNRITGEVIGYDPWIIPSKFDPLRRSVFLTHGWHDNTDKPWIKDFIDKLLSAKDFNVITVDWRKGADVGYLFYDQPASNTRTVGAQTALVMEHLVATGGTTWGRLWCMGHSLGAHVCGLAGMEVRKRGGVIGRVTGFDPAGVNFEKSPDLTIGVNPTSAAFVDIIHTTTILGTKRTLGHMDFYPSDGDFQDGCGVDGACGHSRSEQYFRESIVNDCFLATEICTDYKDIPGSCTDMGRVVAKMGFRADVSGQHGIYRLDINRRSPFCKG